MGSSVTYATRDPAHKSASMTLSNWNLTWVSSLSSNRTAVRSTISKSSGKWYWENKKNSSTQPAIMITWIVNSSESLNDGDYIWRSTNWRWYWWQNWRKVNSSQVGYGSTYTNWDVIWIALNMDSWTITFYKNNVSQWTAFIWITWSIFAWTSTNDTWSHTVNFWATTMTYTAPSGYNQWLYV